MVESVSVILHFNIDYAEIPRRELPKVIENSYRPMIDLLGQWDDVGTICFNLTGHTIEYLNDNHPELIDKIKSLTASGVIDLLATGYGHPILPLLPSYRIRKQIKAHLDYVDTVFNLRPKGAWPPELAVSPLILKIFKELGIEWIAVDHEHYQLFQTLGNDFNIFERREPATTEVLARAFWSRGTLKKLRVYWKTYKFLLAKMRELTNPLIHLSIGSKHSIKGLLTSVSWSNATQIALSGSIPIYSLKTHLRQVIKHPARHLPIYASDVEFFGYRELGTPPPPPQKLIELLEMLQQKGIKIVSPSQLPDEQWEENPKFIGTGSWSPDKSLRMWTESEDNRSLARLLREIYQKLSKLGSPVTDDDKLEQLLRKAENSDARGWAPLPERKKEAYLAILSIFEILEQLEQKEDTQQ